MIEEPINCSVSNKTYIFADIFWVRSNESSFGPKVRCAFVLIVWDIVRESMQVVMGNFMNILPVGMSGGLSIPSFINLILKGWYE